MLERRTMIGGVIGPNDTEFMGYPIVNSIEGPLPEITISNCTEGCITRLLVDSGDQLAIVACVLRLNNKLYILDSSNIILVHDDFSYLYQLHLNPSDDSIGAARDKFPNIVAQ